MNKPTSLCQYIAEHNMDGANDLLTRYGIPRQNSVPDATHCMNALLAKKGEAMIPELADIHPDKQIIREFIAGPLDYYADGTHHNCSGCSGCSGKNKKKFSNFTDGVESNAVDQESPALASSAPTVIHSNNIFGILAIIVVAGFILHTIK